MKYSFKIGNVLIDNPIIVAPMAGVTNTSYRKICKEMGAGLVVAEMVSDKALIFGNEKTFALLKNPDKIQEIVSAVVKAVKCPVTVKIRSGWDSNSINAVKVAKICEAAGASAIAVHARTRAQGYSGKANWNIIKDVVNNVNIPVIGNGDVLTCYDAKKMMDETGCKGVMIGRGVLGNPWLIKECKEYIEEGKKPNKISLEDKLDMMKRHIILLYQDKNEKEATLELRSMLMYYLKGLPNTHDLKTAICKCNSKEEYLNLIKNYHKLIF